MFKLPQKVINETQKYRENLKKFLSGELEDAFFRGMRVPWGNYSQRGGKLLMSRLRIPGGILTPEQLEAIGMAAKNFANSKLHITTRQDIQIHNVPYENSIKIIEYLKDFNISPRGGGGNTVRNITTCYLSGICPYENIEVYKIVWGLSEYLLSFDESYNLPRKLKITFSGCQKDCVGVGVNDVGFVAMNGDFKVICGGGMGAKSAVGKILQENVEQEEVGYIVKSITNIFNKYGDRKSKHHNRLRFLIQDIGWERFVELYKQELNRLKEAEYIVLKTKDGLSLLPQLDVPIQRQESLPEDKEYQLFRKYNTERQKQKGYWYVKLRIPFGEIDSDALISLSQIGEVLPTINFRTNQRQNLTISNIPEDKVYFVYGKVKSLLKDYLFPETILDIVSCKATTTCNLGICNAVDLAPEIMRELKKINLDIDKLKNVKININGCPNACGHHPTGMISLSGLARKVYNRTVPFYKVYLGGKMDAENTKLAEGTGIVPARALPKLISQFISVLQENINEDVYQYVSKEGKDFMKELIKRYSFVPPYEEDKSYYIDFGRSEEFSLDGLSPGECGAGVIDMIESDLESARHSLANAKEKDFYSDEIKNALIHSARALLVVKGVDPRNEQETIFAFIDKFVKTGICHPEFENLNKIYTDIISANVSGKKAYEHTQKFYQEAKKIYSLMDSNFNFSIRFREERKKQERLSSQDRPMVYDLRGTPCPMNYVKLKLKLEELNIGDILEVYLDDGEPIQNVPESLRNDGQEILKIEPIQNFFKVLVEKKI